MSCLPEVSGDGGAGDEIPFKGKEVTQMPGFNRRGPEGTGPMTGGGRGCCSSKGPAFGSKHGAREYGGRDGGSRNGRGFCRGFRRTIGDGRTPKGQPREMDGIDRSADELRVLKAQVDEMSATLDKLNKRLGDSEKASDK